MSARRRLRELQRLRRDDRGAVAVVVSVLMVVFIGLSAFTIDYGYAYAQRRALSSTADGAALAAAEEFRRTRTSNQTCDTMLSTNRGAGDPAGAAANLVKTANGPQSSELDVSYLCDGGYLMVTATMSKTTNAFFGGIYGKDSYDVWRTAKAVVAPAGSVTGAFRPFGLCEEDARRVLLGLTTGSDANSGTVKVKLAKTAGTPCGVGVNENVSADGTGTESRIRLGPEAGLDSYLKALEYTGNTTLSIDGAGNVICKFVSIPDGWCKTYTGVGGANNDVTRAINALLDTTFMFPVYNQTRGGGENTEYRISGFISAKLCGWQLKNIEESQGKPKVNPGTCYDGSALKKFDKADGDALQLRAARYVPPAEFASCPPPPPTDGTPPATGTPCSLTTAGSNYEFVPVIAKLFG